MERQVGEVARKNTVDQRRADYFKLNAYAGLIGEGILNEVAEHLSLITSPVDPYSDLTLVGRFRGAGYRAEVVAERSEKSLGTERDLLKEVCVVIGAAALRRDELNLIDAQRHGLHFIKP